MYLLGHLGVGLLAFAPLAYHLCRTGRDRLACIGTATVLLLASSPDVDMYVPGIAHRGITHTVWAALLVGALLAFLGWRLHTDDSGQERAAGFASLLGITSVGSHLLGDVLTPMGIRPFAPLVETEYTLSLVAARNPEANLLLLVAGVLSVSPSFGRVWARAGYPLPSWPVRLPGGRADVASSGPDPVSEDRAPSTRQRLRDDDSP
ncbi:metal-dependent hydrolase [Haloarcula nitratireducens]|uniref:Metal-dependent hydrolase n=1 Tax=Haloarcula nitratireducens TaxID=2487749 RepID=A0AAW4PBC0_9EURY|nr:metal-dependent hydrolase [Halomicroarcula nitratireducens]MBX0295184.1 metal-dependent hydrolase [Halomicroarcula nitratireducens]